MCMRRFIFVIVVLHAYQQAILQAMVIQILNFTAFIYIAEVRPYQDPFLNKMEMFNEFANIICVNLVFCFSDVITDSS